MAGRDRPESQEALGPAGNRVQSHPHIFPNMWVAFPGEGQISMRMPKGPMKTEIWWFSFNDPATPTNRRALATFGPAGLLEQGVVSKRYPVNYTMNLGRGEIIENEGDPPLIEASINEHA